ncbi:iron ABC transporter ATP-binding protein [Candidatus Magnetoovum chiemensis]|nr:iron ABC transporter ATP-binding protein [Candidatus Magnetoovum chiemensis]
MINLRNIKAKQGDFFLSVNSLSINKGQLIAVMGNNGSGKSTFLQIIAGIKSFTGDYALFNTDMKDFTRLELARKIGLFPQERSLNMPFDVSYVVLSGRYARSNGISYTDKDMKETQKWLVELDIDRLSARLFNELSGGEKQRVFLSRVLNMDTDVILLDEPFSAIDMAHQLKIINLLKTMAQNKIIIVVIHDLSFAIQHFTKFLFFKNGALLYNLDAAQLEESHLSEIFDIKIAFYKNNGRSFVYTEC